MRKPYMLVGPCKGLVTLVRTISLRTGFGIFVGLGLSLTELLCSAMSPAEAAQQTIRILIESSFQTTGTLFMQHLIRNLPVDAREQISFEPTVLSSPEVQRRLHDPSWHLAIISTSTFSEAKVISPAVAFDMPFLFSDFGSVTDLERSHVGQAGLGTLSELGMTGLVYLNAGLTLVANRKELTTPNDLKGRTVAVFDSGQAEQFSKIGTVPQLSQVPEIWGAVRRGTVDSVAINSTNPSSWVFPEQGFLLTDSINAQVAVVATFDRLWDEIPFLYRAMIGDAAILVSQTLDRDLIETDKLLVTKAKLSNLSLVTFKPEDASRATQEWISQQPAALRQTYSNVHDFVKKMLCRVHAIRFLPIEEAISENCISQQREKILGTAILFIGSVTSELMSSNAATFNTTLALRRPKVIQPQQRSKSLIR
jgi:TRAP-type C4-dicarboxylate transport system substrate-binding protein